MHQPPPVDQALVQELTAQAQAHAESTCHSLLGDYTTLEVVEVGTVQESILKYFLNVDYLCGRAVSHPALVVPSLVSSVTDGDFDLAQLAQPLLLKTGDYGAVALVDFSVDEGAATNRRALALASLGDFLAGKADHFTLHEAIQEQLFEAYAYYLPNDLAYDAAESLARSESLGLLLERTAIGLPVLRPGQLVLASAYHFKAPNYYATPTKALQALFDSQTEEGLSYALHTLAVRGFKAGELGQFLPLLVASASPSNPALPSEVFGALAAAPLDARILPLLVQAIDPALLASTKGQSFVFQAMIAFRNCLQQPGAAGARPALEAIAQSDVNPGNRYLQTFATQLLGSLAP